MSCCILVLDGLVDFMVMVTNVRIKSNYVSDVFLGKRKRVILRGGRIKKDDRLYLYAEDDRRRLRSTRCDDVRDIHISSSTAIIIDSKVLTDEEMQQLAIDEGYSSFKTFISRLRVIEKLPLEGQVVSWL